MAEAMGTMGFIMGTVALANSAGAHEVPIEHAMIVFGILGVLMVAFAVIVYLALR